jgi:hypothetical protein
MKAATFDPAKRLDLYFRCNRSGSKDFVFTNEDGSAHSLIYLDFTFNIYQNQGERKVYITLPLAYNQNTLTASITKALSNINEGEYYYELYNVDTEETWLCGDAIFHNGKFDGVTETEDITIITGGESIAVTVSVPGYSLSVSTITTTTTLTPNGSFDAYEVTAQSGPLTIANPSTDYANFDGFMVRFYTASSQTLALGNKYRAQGEAFITSTTAGKFHILTAIFDSTNNKYDTRISVEV